ncbi:outer membrane beta-barrel protein [Zobellia barbeyronii]|uniref:Outer membrane beta-barrel protein n=1 Tax=Zobellia barbeyronii TaxID=2748009 RepID=A0ABS5WAL7_9FLAO|nr:outer membrane beta-barrel protein [Zobellia barbeyronii]MBT2160392.1 outer membrane beta-barrel protein [Zobellia barbeyronii]
MSKKNIDNLFQEKFRDFEEIPDEKVWNAIEASLDKKKKKKVIPIWWTLGGTAAALVIALVAFYPFSKNDVAPNIISDTEKVNDTKDDAIKNTNKFIIEPTENIDEAVVVSSKTDVDVNTVTDSYKEKKEDKNSNALNTEAPKKDTKNKSDYNQGFKTSQDTELAQIDQTEDAVNAEIETKNSDKVDYAFGAEKSQEAATSSANSRSNDDFNSPKNNPTEATGIALTENRSNNLKPNTEDPENSTSKTNVDDNITKSPDELGITENTTEEEKETEKKSIFDEIETEEEIVTADKSGRWSAGPNIAPVYYNALGEGSPVNSIFNENSKSGNTNLSYGLTVAYAINKKLSIRSGLNKVDYGYDTNGVAFSSTLQEASTEKIQNIDYSSTAKNIVVTSQSSNFSSSPTSDSMFAFEISNATSSQRDGTMAQQFGYLEVPLELDYALIDRKFGLNILGGISSLFLIDNSVTLTSGELTTEIGEANNVNSVNFSTNIGFGVNYKFTPKIRFNVEPVFKYQLNTFSDVSGDFRPFSIGVYSGLNFKF